MQALVLVTLGAHLFGKFYFVSSGRVAGEAGDILRPTMFAMPLGRGDKTPCCRAFFVTFGALLRVYFGMLDNLRSRLNEERESGAWRGCMASLTLDVGMARRMPIASWWLIAMVTCSRAKRGFVLNALVRSEHCDASHGDEHKQGDPNSSKDAAPLGASAPVGFSGGGFAHDVTVLRRRSSWSALRTSVASSRLANARAT